MLELEIDPTFLMPQPWCSAMYTGDPYLACIRAYKGHSSFNLDEELLPLLTHSLQLESYLTS